MDCVKCSATCWKNGMARGMQRWKCCKCSYQFTRTTRRGHPSKDKVLALILRSYGVSMNMSARVLRVSTQTVMRWLRDFDAQDKSLRTIDAPLREAEIDEIDDFLLDKLKSSKRGSYFATIKDASSSGTLAIVLTIA